MLLVLGVIFSMTATILVSDAPEHHAKCMCFSLDPAAPAADVAALVFNSPMAVNFSMAVDSPMAVKLPFPGEFVNGEFQVIYETL
jgi:hypothetical protein